MRILITGATGFVGKHLIPQMFQSDLSCHEFALVNYDQENAIELYAEYAQLSHIDISSDTYKKKIKEFNPECVLHLASFLTSKDDDSVIDTIINANIRFGTHLLDALSNTDLKYFINFGTCAEYLENDGILKSAYLYAATKTSFRSILDFYQRKNGFNWINVIPYTIYGGVDTQKKVLDYIISALNAPRKVEMSPGEQRLDFIHVLDVVDFIIHLLKKIENISESYLQFELGTGVGTSIKEVSQIVEDIFGQRANIEWGALPYRPMDLMQAVASTEALTEKLNWTPKYSLNQGIKMMKEQQYHG